LQWIKYSNHAYICANFDESKGSPLLYPAPNSPVIVVYQQPNQAYQQTVYVHQMPPDYLGK